LTSTAKSALLDQHRRGAIDAASFSPLELDRAASLSTSLERSAKMVAFSGA